MQKTIDVIIPKGYKPARKEINAARILSRYLQATVHILRPVNTYMVSTPDFRINGELYELKTPTSAKVERIMHDISDASKQANIVVIDGRKTKMLDKRLAELCRNGLNKKLKRILLITKDRNRIIDIIKEVE